jgi:hypothetical protein
MALASLMTLTGPERVLHQKFQPSAGGVHVSGCERATPDAPQGSLASRSLLFDIG